MFLKIFGIICLWSFLSMSSATNNFFANGNGNGNQPYPNSPQQMGGYSQQPQMAGPPPNFNNNQMNSQPPSPGINSPPPQQFNNIQMNSQPPSPGFSSPPPQQFNNNQIVSRPASLGPNKNFMSNNDPNQISPFNKPQACTMEGKATFKETEIYKLCKGNFGFLHKLNPLNLISSKREIKDIVTKIDATTGNAQEKSSKKNGYSDNSFNRDVEKYKVQAKRLGKQYSSSNKQIINGICERMVSNLQIMSKCTFNSHLGTLLATSGIAAGALATGNNKIAAVAGGAAAIFGFKEAKNRLS